ncbi:MAG: hypothetical protein IPI93_09165 [Sphingobacteriaceae bacterium]|nr:hypothetical protein [Sphingobacteriaceae bacterium]MBK7817298.1 hypothetical protein [Sphingobacteriaceae bacterium]
MLIGGYAVIYYGYKRTTGDMDLWLKPSNANKLKLLVVLEKLKFSKADIKHIETLNFEETIAFHFWKDPERVDCLTKISGVSFEEAKKKMNFIELDSLKLPVIHYNHLVLSKITSKRAKDKADIEELQKVNRK